MCSNTMFTSIQAAAPNSPGRVPSLDWKASDLFANSHLLLLTATGFCPAGREKTLLGRNHWSDSESQHVGSINLILYILLKNMNKL